MWLVLFAHHHPSSGWENQFVAGPGLTPLPSPGDWCVLRVVVDMPFPTHSLNESCWKDGLVGAEVGLGGCDGMENIPWKQKVELGDESCSKTPTKLPIC